MGQSPVTITSFRPPDGCAVWAHPSKWKEADWRHWLEQAGRSEEWIRWYLKYRQLCGVAVSEKGKRGQTWLYQPSPKQLEFHLSAEPNVLYGGARGGAKSHALRWDFLLRALKRPDYRGLLLRRTFPELKDNHIDPLNRELAVFGVKVDSENYLRLPGNSVLRLGHCQNEGDEERYLGTEYDWIGIDELATFTRKQAIAVMGSARSAKENVTPMVRSSSNPGGAHTLWVVELFINRTGPEDDEEAQYDAKEWAYVPSRLYDNPWLMDPDGTFRTYERRLRMYSPERRRQLLDGDWTAITGQFFPEFRRERHVRTLEVPKETEYIRAVDWGYNQPGVCLWIACLSDGHYHIRHEYKFQQTIASEVARSIVRQTKDLGIKRVRYTAADPSMFNKTGQTGESHASTFGRSGVPLIPANHERVVGWQRVRHFFADAPDGTPWLTVDPECRYTIRTIPMLVSDEHNPEDVDTEGDDHPGDTVRYACMSWPTPTRVMGGKGKAPEGSIRWYEEREQRRGKGLLSRKRAVA